MSKKGKQENKKVEIQALAEEITMLSDKLAELSAQSLSEDYKDDVSRDNAVRGIDELRRSFYGPITDRQDAQLVYIINQLKESERLDHSNDHIKQQERDISTEIKSKSYDLIHLARRIK